jgi:transcriptional regulator with XRE-family HTH domain
MISTDFSTLLRTYRKSMGWTQEELAQQWSYSFETISAWERGKRTPSKQEIPRLAKLLETDSEKLVEVIIGSREQSEPQVKHLETGTGWKASFEIWGELQHIYRTRTEFSRDFSYARMFEDTHKILAAGISLNAIVLTYSRDALLKAIIEDNCIIQLCFLDPNGAKCAEREEEENYPRRTLADLTGVNLLLARTLHNQIERTSPEHLKNLEIKTYNLTPRFNIYIVDDVLMTVQSYAYG